jgi:hypothetical protein
MTIISRPLSRRTVLRGLGAVIALPALEAMLGPWKASAAGGSEKPVRLAWLHTTSGVRMPRFTPSKTGRDFALSHILQPLEEHRADVSVLSGLYHRNAFKTVASVGRHDLDTLCFLTAADLGRMPGVAVKNSVSVDQVAGRTLGEFTRLPTLNLSAFPGSKLAFDESGTPIPSMTDPVAVFDRLFGTPGDAASRTRRDQAQDSVIDRTLEATRQLRQRLGNTDRDKVDEYLNSLREVERRVQTARKWENLPPVRPPAGTNRPGGTPENLTERIRLLLDLAVLAFQTDQTRVLTLHLGSMECKYPGIGCPDGYHGYTHTNHRDYTDETDQMARVDRERIKHLAYFLGRLKSIKEGGATLLDSAFVHYGSGMGLGHETIDLPNLIAGRAGGQLRPGTHNNYAGQPLANLFLSMLEAAKIPAKTFADSTGVLSDV